MPQGKTFTLSIKSTLPLQQSYELCRKVCEDSKLKIAESGLKGQGFSIKVSEPMKWISTNWPCFAEIEGSLFQDVVLIKVAAYSKMASMTQDVNTNISPIYLIIVS